MFKQGSIVYAGPIAFVLMLSACNDNSTYVVEETVIVPAGEARNVTVNCNAGDLALSGGYRTGADLVPSHFEPNGDVNPDGWRFIFNNPRTFEVNSAYEVLCLGAAP